MGLKSSESTVCLSFFVFDTQTFWGKECKAIVIDAYCDGAVVYLQIFIF